MEKQKVWIGTKRICSRQTTLPGLTVGCWFSPSSFPWPRFSYVSGERRDGLRMLGSKFTWSLPNFFSSLPRSRKTCGGVSFRICNPCTKWKRGFSTKNEFHSGHRRALGNYWSSEGYRSCATTLVISSQGQPCSHRDSFFDFPLSIRSWLDRRSSEMLCQMTDCGDKYSGNNVREERGPSGSQFGEPRTCLFAPLS